MLNAFLNIFKIAELRTKLLFTFGMLVIYRIGFWIPVPGVNQQYMKDMIEKDTQGSLKDILSYISTFTGGELGHSTLFGLGILPYISASIIFTLLATVVPSLEALQKEGPTGRQKIQEYTRLAAIALCVIQSIFYLNLFSQRGWIYPEYIGSWTYWSCGILGMTAGTMFLMWLGEQIDKFGIGNGASLIITAGILAQMPDAIQYVITNFDLRGANTNGITPMKVLFLVGAFVFVVSGAVLITQAQRRIPVQQAKHTRGRRVVGGQRSYLPLRVNHGGVMPIIFASSLMMIPTMLFPWLKGVTEGVWVIGPVADFLSQKFNFGDYLYEMCYIAMIYFFAYFWTTVQFQPKEMANQLRDHGSFIPGLRPGPRTADYLEKVMERITYVGAAFLAIIAVIPSVISYSMKLPFNVASFLGGTGLLIVVSVGLDFIQRIEANLLMRNYQGFLSKSTGAKGPRIHGPRG